MQFLQHKIPPPLVAVICAFFSWFLASGTEPNSVSFALKIVLSMLLVCVGAFIGISGFITFKKAKTTVSPLTPNKASSLVVKGVFKYTRNPMYLCLVLVLMGFSVYLEDLIALVGVGVFIVYMNEFQIKPEEKALTKLFGEEYLEYMARVRRWI